MVCKANDEVVLEMCKNTAAEKKKCFCNRSKCVLPLLSHDDVSNLQRCKLFLHNAQARLLPSRPKVNRCLFNSTSDAIFLKDLGLQWTPK